mgnify:CR=1 FL=1
MVEKTLIQNIEEEAKKYFTSAPATHDWSHVERVDRLASYISQIEGGNLTVIKLSVLLHDIGRKKEEELNGEVCHAEEGAKLARNILESYGVNKEIIEHVCHCIETHRFRNEKEPQTIEAKVLYDADKLDSIGAIGIARACSWSGAHEQKLYSDSEKEVGTGYEGEHTPLIEFGTKLSKIKEHLLTKTGREIAKDRHKLMVAFFERLQQEIDGVL